MSEDEPHRRLPDPDLPGYPSSLFTDELSASFISLTSLPYRGSINIRDQTLLNQDEPAIRLRNNPGHLPDLNQQWQTPHPDQPEQTPGLNQPGQASGWDQQPQAQSPDHHGSSEPYLGHLPSPLNLQVAPQYQVEPHPDQHATVPRQRDRPIHHARHTNNEQMFVRAELSQFDEESDRTATLVSMATVDQEGTPQNYNHQTVTSSSSIWRRSDSLHNWDLNHQNRRESLGWRERTFIGRWPLDFMDPRILAQVGFYYTGHADFVRCYKCGGELGHWAPGDDPMAEHMKYLGHACHP